MFHVNLPGCKAEGAAVAFFHQLPFLFCRGVSVRCFFFMVQFCFFVGVWKVFFLMVTEFVALHSACKKTGNETMGSFTTS